MKKSVLALSLAVAAFGATATPSFAETRAASIAPVKLQGGGDDPCAKCVKSYIIAHKAELKELLGSKDGQPGPAGPKGDKGDAGPAGAKGDKGDTGPAGAKGDKGDTGPAGAKGDKGDTGPAGAKGDKGDTGPAGAKGDKGDTGPAGAKGDKGDTGPAGAKGDKGDTGPAGAKGDKGDTGPAGAKGDKGDTGPAGAKGDKGDTGPAGKDGVAKPVQIVKGSAFLVKAGEKASGEAQCPAGTTVTGGGYFQDDQVNSFPYISRPNADGTAWSVSFKNDGGRPDGDTVTPYAVCLPVG